MSELSAVSSQRSVFLYGPSGSGKSTVGKLLAKNLNLPFIDLDVEIEARGGKPIPEIFASEGEASFREKERQTLSVILTPGEKVIALGGGALTTPESHTLAESKGEIVMLNAPPEILLERLQADTIERPLIVGNALENLSNLLAKRSDHYASFPMRVDTEGKSPDEIAWEIQVLHGKFHVNGMASAQAPGYDVRVQSGGLDHIGDMLKARNLNGPVAVVTDTNVGEQYLAQVTESLTNCGYEAHGITIQAGEEFKTLETASNLWAAFLSAKIERSSTIIGLGGGVVGDLAGFAAATFLRGVPWVAVPTSLLAMVDASLGGKTGADLPQGKNLIGAFYPPKLVLADPEGIQTLPEEEFISGMAEVIKHGIIADPKLLRNLPGFKNLGGLDETIRRAMAVKILVIEEDPFEKGLRAALNYGHTVGHGVELVSGFQIKHGEAVAIGMVVEARMAEQIGLAPNGLADQIAQILTSVGLPTEIPFDLDRTEIIAAMHRDKKKAAGIVRFALPAAIGNVRVGVEAANWETVISDQ